MNDTKTHLSAHLAALPDFLTADDMAKALQTTVRTIRRLTSRGKLPQPIHLGRLRRWPRPSILAMLQSPTP